MTRQKMANHETIANNPSSESTTIQSPFFTIKFGLFMAFLVSILLPLVLFLPFIAAKLLDLPLIEQVVMTADNFGMFILFSQAIGLIISIIFITKRLKKYRLTWSDIGLKGFKIFQGIRYVAGYYLILLGLLIAVAVIATSTGIEVPATPDGESGGTEMLNVMGGFWMTFILSVVLAPIIEEIIFRGILFTALKKRYGIVSGVILSSLVFTLVHMDPIQMISVLPLGIYLAIAYQRTKSIYPGIALHASWNLLVLLIAQYATHV